MGNGFCSGGLNRPWVVDFSPTRNCHRSKGSRRVQLTRCARLSCHFRWNQQNFEGGGTWITPFAFGPEWWVQNLDGFVGFETAGIGETGPRPGKTKRASILAFTRTEGQPLQGPDLQADLPTLAAKPSCIFSFPSDVALNMKGKWGAHSTPTSKPMTSTAPAPLLANPHWTHAAF